MEFLLIMKIVPLSNSLDLKEICVTDHIQIKENWNSNTQFMQNYLPFLQNHKKIIMKNYASYHQRLFISLLKKHVSYVLHVSYQFLRQRFLEKCQSLHAQKTALIKINWFCIVDVHQGKTGQSSLSHWCSHVCS